MPADPISLAVVGLRFGQHVIDGDLVAGRTPFRLAAICDSDPVRLAEAAAKYGVPAYASLEPLLADSSLPAICLITPPAGRAALVRRCLQAGKHVMTTKPFETDPEAAASVLAEASAAGLAVHLNSPGPQMAPWVQQARTWVERHRLGRPSLIEWHTHASYREQADGGWYDDPARCPVAPLFRLGIYALNDIHQLIDDDPEAVTVLTSRVRTGRPTPDVAQATVRYRTGCLVSLACTLACESANYPDTFAAHFERGAVYRGLPPNLGGDEGDLVRVVAGGKETPICLQQAVTPGGHSYDWERFARWLRHGPQADELGPERLLRSLRVIRALAKAEVSGRCEPV